MSDFGANTCDFYSDFHSDFASDFRTEGNDYASDFCDFPGDYDSDFGREARPPTRSPGQHGETTPTAPTNRHQLHRGQPPRQGHRGGARWRQAGSASGNARRSVQRHATRP